VKPHRTDLVSLGFGLVFVGGAALWLTARLVTLGALTVGWFLAGVLILLGGMGFTQVLAAGRRRR
jgi:hypothetical protein